MTMMYLERWIRLIHAAVGYLKYTEYLKSNIPIW